MVVRMVMVCSLVGFIVIGLLTIFIGFAARFFVGCGE